MRLPLTFFVHAEGWHTVNPYGVFDGPGATIYSEQWITGAEYHIKTTGWYRIGTDGYLEGPFNDKGAAQSAA